MLEEEGGSIVSVRRERLEDEWFVLLVLVMRTK